MRRGSCASVLVSTAAVLVALVALPTGAVAQGEEGDAAANAALVTGFFEVVFNERAVDRVGEFLAEDYASHGPAHDRHVDLEATGGFIQETLTVFPDIRIELLDTVAQGDRVAVAWRATGTHQGDMLGLSATGNVVTVMGISLFRIADGRIAEGWNTYDRYDLVLQLEPQDAARDDAAEDDDPQ